MMIERTEATFGIKPDWLVADTAYGSAPNLHFLVDKKDIEPHVPVIDKSQRDDGTFSREDFVYDATRDVYVCLNGKILPTNGRLRDDGMYAYYSRVRLQRLPVQAGNAARRRRAERSRASIRGGARRRQRRGQDARLRTDPA